jgi:ectoine hydroxylase-related dioxygenase (phytanoyl-CoA dioxygenase family)
MAIVTEEHRKFFQENGYVKIEGVVPKENCERVIEAIWACLGKDPTNPDNWYDHEKGVINRDGMVEMYQHQALWDNRQHPQMYEAFSELLGEKKLWVSVDRVNMKPPKREGKENLDSSFIHWDADTTNLTFPLPKPFGGVQGVLYIADTAENQGGFQCVPSLYREFEEWLKTQPADRNPRVPDITGYKVESIPGKAGDLVIWDRLLAHGNGHNYAGKPRYAQYISMNRADPGRIEWRQRLIEGWRTRSAPAGGPFPGDPRRWEQTNFSEPAQLTDLGRKLLGLDAWE